MRVSSTASAKRWGSSRNPGASSEITAGHARDALSAFFTWAMQMGYVEQNPVVGTIQPKKSEGRSRVLARMRPKGLEASVLVSELLPAAGPAALSDEQIQRHQTAVEAFLHGDWSTARELLSPPATLDKAREVLLAFMARTNFLPPQDWDGVISLTEK